MLSVSKLSVHVATFFAEIRSTRWLEIWCIISGSMSINGGVILRIVADLAESSVSMGFLTR